MRGHIIIMKTELSKYFPELNEFEKFQKLIRNPFTISLENLPTESTAIQEQFIELINNTDAKLFFESKSENPNEFWIK